MRREPAHATPPARRQRGGHRAADHQFVVELGSFRHGSTTARHYVADGVLGDLEVSGSFVAADEPVYLDARIEPVHDGVLVTATARTRWQGSCRRCLAPASGELVVELRELCVQDGDPETTYPLGTEELVLDQLVHDACILELPLAPLCDEGCLGICAQCGANRNVDPCACTATADPRWAGLDALRRDEDDPPATSSTDPTS